MSPRPTRTHWLVSPLHAPLIVCGIGFGGFFDGIVFHQILQLHHMLSNAGDDRLGLASRSTDTVAGLELNTVWDGLFHAATYLALLVGLTWLWSRWRSDASRSSPSLSWRLFVGAMATGWGLFNLVEGIVNHHLLAIHHVVEGEHQLVFDLLFLASGILMIMGGSATARFVPATNE